ncbi:cellulose binding domain-containing protein [Streptomyces sp. SPB162]|uniref:cellulose binding domain-containing protein n=1 Tax=Streptomyces sp. SPB162 TaxID=2940560 RepID=UPI002405F1F5|nr:cellulose binding domain-containing protein [Streptomyces sp. SPB162]MDF9813377.1 cell division septation protein DedD [Streptomyces sp. SPB162]
MASTHRRRPGLKTKAIGGLVAAGVVAGGAFALAGSASAAPVGAAYTKTSGWTGGYTGQYEITNSSGTALSGWTLSFDLPAGTTLSSLWNGKFTANGQHITVKPESWNGTVAPGAKVDVGFVAASGGTAADPVNCLINEAKCSVDSGPTATPSGRPTVTASPTASPSPTKTATPTPTKTATPTPTPTKTTGNPTPVAGAGFSPYIDTSLYPAYDMVGTAKSTGVKQYNLAFITSGGGCTPKWGGVTELGADTVAGQIGALRAAGGDVRVSFGGASGSELGVACTSVGDLTAAYGKAVDQFKLTKVDFDIEGGALPDTASNSRRAQAIAALQKSHSGLDVSYTLPAMPTGLTQDGINLLADAKKNGVNISAVNIMAMDYGASFNGDMGQYAIDAATATQAQVKSVLGLSDAAAWKAVAVTPMIGVNDVNTEVFKVDDATQLVNFAKTKGLGWLSMWSSTRDKQCAGGAKNFADASCSSIVQGDLAFTKAFGAFG